MKLRNIFIMFKKRHFTFTIWLIPLDNHVYALKLQPPIQYTPPVPKYKTIFKFLFFPKYKLVKIPLYNFSTLFSQIKSNNTYR